VVVIDVEPIRERFSTLAPFLDERGRRLVAAAEAFAAGYGGIAAVAMATGMAPSTIGRGLKELAAGRWPYLARTGAPHGSRSRGD
jgi:DNA-binding phage protein